MFRFWRRTILIAVVGLAATLGGCLGVVDKALTPPAFYVADDHDLVGPPGTLIRQQPILDAPSGTTAYRLLYRSTGLDGKSIPVSGFIVIPERANPCWRQSHRRMGASNQRGGSSLRAFEGVVEIRQRSGPQRYGETRLCYRCHGLSRARDFRAASVSGRGQRRSSGTGFGPRRAQHTGFQCWPEIHCVGALARWPSRPVHGTAGACVRARSEAGWSSGGSACDGLGNVAIG